MHQPKVSVIVAVYRIEAYLDACLSSLAAQTYKNIEFILVDDGSPDRCGEICDQYAAGDNRFIALHQKNGGLSAARNLGLLEASGAYVAFVDGDDWVEPVMYERLVNAVLDADAEVAFCGFRTYPPDNTTMPLPCHAWRSGVGDAREAVWQCLCPQAYYATVWNKLYRRELLFADEGRLISPFDTDLRYGEDEVWLVGLLSHCKKTVFLPLPLYHWRNRNDSIVHSSKATAERLSLLDAKAQTLTLVRPYGEDFVRLARARTYNDVFQLLLGAYTDDDIPTQRKIRAVMRTVFMDFMRCRQIRLLRRCKLLLLRAMLGMHLPARMAWQVFIWRG